MIHYKAILKVMGGLMMLLGVLMLPSISFSFYYQSGDHFSLIGAAFVCIISGFVFFFSLGNQDQNIRKREGYMIVAFSWVVMGVFGMLPYLS
ncbi:MAG: hypothetical protein WDZ72_08145 [Cyclobacteriaceae bacterium]